MVDDQGQQPVEHPIQEAGLETIEWQAIRLDEFVAPSEPTTEAVRLRLRDWWQQLVQRRAEPTFDDQPASLTSAPVDLLDYLLPAPDWETIGSHTLASLCAQHDFTASPSLVFVTPPYFTAQQALLKWAERENALILEPPTPEQILQSPEAWLHTWPDQPDMPVVIPALERCYLRHQRGLGLVRTLIETLGHSRRPSIILCNSWAWAFLTHACATNLLTTRPWTPEGLDATQLDRLFAQLIQESGQTHYTFRRADNGKITLRMTPDDDSDYSAEYLTHLAAYTLGNPIVAWTVWRRSLLVAADEDNGVKAGAVAEADQDRRRKVWVQTWEKVPRPQLTAPLEDLTAFILHSLLLHNGLSTSLLHRLLPAHPVDLSRALRYLYVAGIVQENTGRWTVTAAAYPEVRRGLLQQGFLVDAL
jgi:hypothetical protein